MTRVAWIPLGSPNDAAARLRAYQVADALQRRYGIENFFPGTPMPAPPDVLVSQRFDPGSLRLAREIRAFGTRTFLDLSANVFDPDSPNYNYRTSWDKKHEWDIDAALGIFDCVIASSPRLAARLRDRYPGISCRVVSDYIDLARIRFDPKVHMAESRPYRIGWFGQEWNLKPALMLVPTLARLHARAPLFLRLVTNAILYDLGTLPVEFVRWNLDSFERDLQACDVVILPMEIDRFNDVRSPNRLQLCMALGLPAVVSPLPSYLDILSRRPEIAFVAREPHEWFTQLLRLTDPALRNRVAAAASAAVQEYSLEAHCHEWHDALSLPPT
jgi:glycosyltransferase involved in cell wall biosynthesis